MLQSAILIVLTFFAIIGFLECVLGVLETVSTARYESVDDISLTVHLSGKVENVAFLLNTLLLQAERINYKNTVTRVVVRYDDCDDETFKEIHSFCQINDNISVEN